MRKRTQFVTTGNPETVNDAIPQYMGQLGQIVDVVGKTYRYVRVDSGATAATPQGVVANNQVAFWKDRVKHLVTNDLRFSFRNNVAGVFRNAISAGYCGYVQIAGIGTIKDAGTSVIDDILIANSGTNADATNIAAGTAPTYLPIGRCRVGVVAGVSTLDIQIPDVLDYSGYYSG